MDESGLRITGIDRTIAPRRYTSPEVLLNPIDEAGDRGLERIDILTLIFL